MEYHNFNNSVSSHHICFIIVSRDWAVYLKHNRVSKWNVLALQVELLFGKKYTPWIWINYTREIWTMFYITPYLGHAAVNPKTRHLIADVDYLICSQIINSWVKYWTLCQLIILLGFPAQGYACESGHDCITNESYSFYTVSCAGSLNLYSHSFIMIPGRRWVKRVE